MTDENGSQAQQRDSERAFQERLAESCQDMVRPASQEDQKKECQKGTGCQGGPATHFQT